MKPNDEALERVEIVPYDSRWPLVFQIERALLGRALSSLIVDLEHIGSTAVPNLPAKPIIDMMASTERLEEAAFVDNLGGLGYVIIQTGMENRLLFRRTVEMSGQMFHLHLVGADTWERRKERIMRDYLIHHPAEATAYGALKTRLALSYADDSLAYTRAKTTFIQEMMDRACHYFDRPLIDVWTNQQK